MARPGFFSGCRAFTVTVLICTVLICTVTLLICSVMGTDCTSPHLSASSTCMVMLVRPRWLFLIVTAVGGHRLVRRSLTWWVGGAGGGGGSSREIMAGLWTTVQLPPLLPEEEMEILQGAFPELGPLLAPALEVLRLCQDPSRVLPRSLGTSAGQGLVGVPLRKSGRHFSLRDLFKWCRRLQVHCSPPSPFAYCCCTVTVLAASLSLLPRCVCYCSSRIVVRLVWAHKASAHQHSHAHAFFCVRVCSRTRSHMHTRRQIASACTSRYLRVRAPLTYTRTYMLDTCRRVSAFLQAKISTCVLSLSFHASGEVCSQLLRYIRFRNDDMD